MQDFNVHTLADAARSIESVTAPLAFNLAHYLYVSINGLLAGAAVPSGTCPHCGRAPDFGDQETTESRALRSASDGLKLVK